MKMLSPLMDYRERQLVPLARADRIGVVVALGSHEELLALGGRYAGLFASWSATARQSAA